MKRHDTTNTGAAADYLTSDQFAHRLQLHPESVRRMLRTHRLHGIKIGRGWRIPTTELERMKLAGGL